MVNKRCSELYNLHRDVAVDEAMIKFQGRSTLKQYVPKKPIKRGIKVWVLADSHNGYFHSMQVYTGKESTPEKHLGARVVKDLTTSLKNKYHCMTGYYLVDGQERALKKPLHCCTANPPLLVLHC